MPEHARRERKNLGATVGSKIAASEDTEKASSALCKTEILSVKKCPPAAKPELPKRGNDREEVRPAMSS